MKRFRHSVCIGKFLPPHRGHRHLIETAFSQSQCVTVFVCEKTTDGIPGRLRVEWLQAIHPAADVRLIADSYEADDDSELWARLTIGWLGAAPDAVFTSEPYGDPYARALGCTHVLVDLGRTQVPCSGSEIRQDPFRYWAFLEPPVRGWFAKRVCVLGAESTGTTTLAQALARELKTECVAEYGREYCAEKLRSGEHAWRSKEFGVIAQEQNRRENAAACRANRVLICDTNSFATQLWHRRYLGCESEAVARIAAHCSCDLYLLTGDEIPFVQDGLRDGEHLRHEMHAWFVAALAAQSTPWRLIAGPPEARLAHALDEIEALFSLLDRR